MPREAHLAGQGAERVDGEGELGAEAGGAVPLLAKRPAHQCFMLLHE